MISRVLNTEHTEESAPSVNLAKLIEDIAAKWNIFDKVVAVVTDNAFNIVGAIKILAAKLAGVTLRSSRIRLAW
uniref:DUF659 domain-containing protein n=1 Tax=Daphnia galeata TaxID=27404 RepID=A0A8J2RKI1_9CRUS|nr:unnamed protein product [Daphnia galeata]